MAQYRTIISRSGVTSHVNAANAGKNVSGKKQVTEMKNGKPVHVRDVSINGKGQNNPALSGTVERLHPPYKGDRR